MNPIRILKDHPDAVIPTYATQGAAGFDLHAVIDDPDGAVLQPGRRLMVSTGLRLAIPEGWEMQIRPRSGLAARHGVTVLNSPGTIDADYRGVVQIILVHHGDADLPIRTGDRIAQGVIAKVWTAPFLEVQDPCDLGETLRGSGGFGSTGTN